jgi:hypothetical protein
MYYPEFIKALADMPVAARVIRWRKRGEHLYKSAVIIPIFTPEGPQYNLYTSHLDKVGKLEDIFIIGCWPIEDCVKIMSVLYSYNDEIIGEV